MGPRSQLSWRSLAVRAGQRPKGIIARVGPSGQTRKKVFSQRPPEAPNNPSVAPLLPGRLPALGGETPFGTGRGSERC